MKLKLDELRTLAKKTMQETKEMTSFRRDVRNAFGPTMRIDGNIDELSRRVNQKLEILERSAGGHDIKLPTSTLVKLARHKSSNARQVAARLLPGKIAIKLANDRSPMVREQVAKRAPLHVLIEMSKKFPNDDQLQTIKRSRLLHESLGDITPLNQPSPATGDVVQSTTIELSDVWYEDQARKFLEDYGEFTRTPVPVERHWNPLAVRRYCDSVKATSGVEIDQKKLLDAINKLLKELDELRSCCYGSMKEIRSFIKKQALINETLQTPVIPIFNEKQNNVVKSLLQNHCSNKEYVDLFERVFHVKKAAIPAAIRNYRLGEGIYRSIQVPMKAQLPYQQLDVITENALDRYINAWNSQQSLLGIPLKLGWNIDSSDVSYVCFDLELF